MVRCALNGLRATASAVALFAAFGRVCDKFVFSHRCRNDGFSSSYDALLLIAITLSAVALPCVKMWFEVTFYVRRTSKEILWSRSDEWRRRLLHPSIDAVLTLTPLLGALLFPEGYQENEDQGRTCLRGWGCEATATGVVLLLGIGSLLWGVLLMSAAACWFTSTRDSSRRRSVQWGLVLAFPLWLAWFTVCVCLLVSGKSSGYKQLNFLATFSLSGLQDLRYYSFVPTIVLANGLLDVPCYLIFWVLWGTTALPDRTLSGQRRVIGVRSVSPRLFNNPSTSPLAHAAKVHPHPAMPRYELRL